jgi:hypothetical protein
MAITIMIIMPIIVIRIRITTTTSIRIIMTVFTTTTTIITIITISPKSITHHDHYPAPLAGFLSSGLLGTFFGPLADKFGRKRAALMYAPLHCVITALHSSLDAASLFYNRFFALSLCVRYCLLYTVSCATKHSGDVRLLVFGRVCRCWP